VKTEVICTHGSLPSAPLGEEGVLSRLPTANTHVRKDMPGRHPGRFQIASLELSKHCSCMPLVGLVRLRRAQEGEIPFFDPIRTTGGVV
jgi:hypothetical protein